MKRALVIGAGGIGNPACLALARSGQASLLVVDEDEVELSNLHRQILFSDADVGQPKPEALRRALLAAAPGASISTRSGRFLPETARELLDGVDVVLDGTDNFPTRFLVADACALAGVPVVHAAAVRWRGTCFVSGAAGRGPCYRCLFEDLPPGPAPDCATAGVVGPLCGVVGALAADAALRILRGDPLVHASVASFDGKTGRFRRIPVAPRPACPLCGDAPRIRDLDRQRYAGADCASG